MKSEQIDQKKTLLVSTLVFSGTANIENLLGNLPQALMLSASKLSLNVVVAIRVNNPQLEIASLINKIDEINAAYHPLELIIINEGENVGFGAGHNSNFSLRKSDYFLILNDDLDFPHLDFMDVALPRMEANQKLAMVGDQTNPQAITPFFGNGVFPSDKVHHPHRYVEASILLVKSEIFERVGMFDETIRWAMCEDADLSLKVQQNGYQIDWMVIPHRHFRSTSFNSLPHYEKSSILERNRARMFAKWGYSFQTGVIGKHTIFDVFSDGIGDVLCSLVCIAAELELMSHAERQMIVVNCSSPELAAIILGDDVKIASVNTLDRLVSIFGRDNIASLRSTRNLNYALPFGIYSLIAGALSTRVPNAEVRQKVTEKLRAGCELTQVPADYCVLHLEFLRPDHHGRGPSPVVIERIIAGLSEAQLPVVVVGKNASVPSSALERLAVEVIDLQGKLSLLELIAVVSRATYFVGIDSLPFHVAQIAGVPAAVFFGSVNPLTRVVDESRVWPITASIECLGCYHSQLEPGAPFCMRMNQQCTIDVSEQAIIRAIESMTKLSQADYGQHRQLLTVHHARLLDYMKHHPSPDRRLMSSEIPNRSMSELIYRITDQITSVYADHAQGGVISGLISDNTKLRNEVSESRLLLNKYELNAKLNPLPHEKAIKSFPMHDLLEVHRECSYVLDEETLDITSNSYDPQIMLRPLYFDGDKLGMSIVASSSIDGDLKLYWGRDGEEYAEERCVSFALSSQPMVRIWWYGGSLDAPVRLRIDPLDRPGRVKLRVRILGHIDIQKTEKQLRGTTKQSGLSRIWRSPST